MKFSRFFINIVSTLLLFCSNIYAETIFFAPIPQVVKETTIGSNLPLVDYLKKTTNLPIELTYISNYEELIEQFKKGKVQIITLGPLPYVKLKSVFPHTKAIVLF
ncbi:MAG: PhnD/SsuA/transferrin family substrate-binding protein, partial [Thermodesulfovibrionales bacterium]|nr:PhnD/SsuA/transferrin family substrate-binding protein [Thermodesulfovibrionales bacterium]